MLLQKYKPKSSNEIKGHDLAIKKLKRCLITKQPCLVYGGVGVGKTSCIYALAKDLDYEVIEVNASDYRNKEQVESIVGNAFNQQSLFNKKKLILIDELDGLNLKDRGGLQYLTGLLDNKNHAIVFVANDLWDKRFNTLKKKCENIEFSKVHHLFIFEILKNICKKGGFDISETDLKEISRRNDGDVRASINDLELLIHGGKDFYERERIGTMFNFLKLIFNEKDSSLILNSFDELRENFDEIFNWIEENIPSEYYDENLSRGFDNLSKSDVFKGRVRRNNYYRFWIYRKILMSWGVALAKKNQRNKYVNYHRNTRFLKMWQAKMRNIKTQNKVDDISERCHMSLKKSRKEFNYMKFLH
ncbi:AAA family ATPase [archaeon]|nr:AAA family ATPase [archaeon]